MKVFAIYKATFSDGYQCTIMESKKGFYLEGNRRTFQLLSELEAYYGGRSTIKLLTRRGL